MNSELQIEIDRFIDNELDEAGRRQLLERCDADPAGWRALALGLIEAREVTQTLALLREDPADNPPTPPTITRAAGVTRLMTVACLVLIAFFAGRTTQPTAPTPNGPGNNIASRANNSARPQGTGVSDTDQLTIVGVAQIHYPFGAEPPVPIISGPDLDHREMLNQVVALPDHIRRQYRNQGMTVQSVRRVMSLKLANGQQYAIPLDKLGVRYVGHKIL